MIRQTDVDFFFFDAVSLRMQVPEERVVRRPPPPKAQSEVRLCLVVPPIPHIWQILAERLPCARCCHRHQGDGNERDTQAALLANLVFVRKEETVKNKSTVSNCCEEMQPTGDEVWPFRVGHGPAEA